MAVVSVDILKKETVPKSESVSIATNESPTTIAGLAEGRIIFKKVFLKINQGFFLHLLNFEIDNKKMRALIHRRSQKEKKI